MALHPQPLGQRCARAVGRVEDQPAAGLDAPSPRLPRRRAVAASRPIRSTSRAAGRPPAARSSRATRAAGCTPSIFTDDLPLLVDQLDVADRQLAVERTSAWPMPKAALAAIAKHCKRVKRHRHVGVDARARTGQDRAEQLEHGVQQAGMNVVLVGIGRPRRAAASGPGPRCGVRPVAGRSQEKVGPRLRSPTCAGPRLRHAHRRGPRR